MKGDPLKVALATAILTMAVSLDGDGATTFLITVSAMLPLYQRLGMDRLVLSGIVCLGAGVMNIIPWGGPTVRAMAALKADASVIFNPVVPAMLVGILWVLLSPTSWAGGSGHGLASPRSTTCRPSRSPASLSAAASGAAVRTARGGRVRRSAPRPCGRAEDRARAALALLVQHRPDGRAGRRAC